MDAQPLTLISTTEDDSGWAAPAGPDVAAAAPARTWSPARTRALARYNAGRLLPGSPAEANPEEIAYVEACRACAAPLLPAHCDDWAGWFTRLQEEGPGQGDPLHPWLAEQASRSALEWFLRQEAAGEAGFGDLVALMQIKMPPRVKLEMARNYWDEMGNGRAEWMHDRLLQDALAAWGLTPAGVEEALPAALDLSNLLLALACQRRYAWQAVGALGVIEMTAPGRVALVARGLARCGMPAAGYAYFTLHAALDVKHSRDWNREVIGGLPPPALRPMAEGALLRLWAGARCYAAYRRHLWGGDGSVAPAAP